MNAHEIFNKCPRMIVGSSYSIVGDQAAGESNAKRTILATSC
jgi:hypothetical protein